MNKVVLGNCELYLGNCLEVMSELAEQSIDAIITDPPWMNYVTGWYDASVWHEPVIIVEPSVYCERLWQLAAGNTAHLIWCRWDSFENHRQAMIAAGFQVKNCIVWAKPNHTAGDLNGNVGNKHEMAVFAVKGNWKRHDKREVNLWNEQHLFTRSKRDHPTQKPINLMKRCVRLTANLNATILDPFMGSGTTGVACIQTGRKFIGIEIVPKYFDIAVKRIQEAQMQLKLF